MRKQTKLVAVASAAALLALGASMTSFAAGWTEEDGTWVYLNKDGDRVYNEWKKSGPDYYYLNDDGEMATEVVVEHEGQKYYVDATGKKVVNTWVELDNEDDVTVNNQDVSTLWMYFDGNGKAVNSSTKPKKIGGKYYIFDTEGYMMSGWVNLDDDKYFCGDESEGWAYTGWQYLEPDEDDADVPYDESVWYYFGSNGKAAKNTTKYIGGKYYTFNGTGVLTTNWYDVATPAGVAGDKAYANKLGTTGLGWVYADALTAEKKANDEDCWYYLTNVREDGKVIGRGIPFNYGGNEYAAKSIKSKTYLFNNLGEMQTGVIELGDVAAVDGGKALAAGIYYFNDEEGASTEGQMMTGKITIEEDAEQFFYHFDNEGKAYTNAIKNGILYGADGKRVQAEDGNKYEIVNVENTITYYDKKDANGDYYEIAEGKLLVNGSGKIRTTDSKVTIEDVKYNVTFDYKNSKAGVVAE